MILSTQEGVFRTSTQSVSQGAAPKRLATVVIDDSSSFADVICALLEREDALDIVARGCDGIEAIEITAKLRPDLLIMDIDMPVLDGLNAALILATRFPDTRIVLMSIDDSPELIADCEACGAMGFIPKGRFRQEFPFVLDKIVQP